MVDRNTFTTFTHIFKSHTPMPSMDYCKFENTAIDLANCVEHIENRKALPTEYEVQGIKEAYELAKRLVKEIDLYGFPELNKERYMEQY